MAQPPVLDPPPSGKRRSARLSRADASHVDAPVPSHGPTEDEAEESPMKKQRAGESPMEKQRSGTTKIKLGRKARDKSTAVELTPNTPTLKAPREPNIELSPATVNLNNFYTLLPKLSINPTAQFELIHRPRFKLPRSIVHINLRRPVSEHLALPDEHPGPRKDKQPNRADCIEDIRNTDSVHPGRHSEDEDSAKHVS
jgi:hypothetical protein